MSRSDRNTARPKASRKRLKKARMQPGDHLIVRRPVGYYHHGVYVGGGLVVQFGGRVADKPSANIEEVTLEEFEAGGEAEVWNHAATVLHYRGRRTTRSEACARARWLCDHHPPSRYNVVGLNCESVATWCAMGAPITAQGWLVLKLVLYRLSLLMAVPVFVLVLLLPGDWKVVSMVPLVALSLLNLLRSLLVVWHGHRFSRFVANYPEPTYNSRRQDFRTLVRSLTNYAFLRL